MGFRNLARVICENCGAKILKPIFITQLKEGFKHIMQLPV